MIDQKINRQRNRDNKVKDQYVNRSWVFKQAYKRYGDELYANRDLFDKICVLERQSCLNWDFVNKKWKGE